MTKIVVRIVSRARLESRLWMNHGDTLIYSLESKNIKMELRLLITNYVSYRAAQNTQ